MRRGRLVAWTGLAALASLLAVGWVGLAVVRRWRRAPQPAAPIRVEGSPPPRKSWLYRLWVEPFALWLILPLRALGAWLGGLRRARVGWLRVIGGLSLLGLLTAANAHLLALSQHGQMALLCGGLVLLLWGLSAGGRLSLPSLSRLELAALIGITLIGFGLRLWRLDTAVHYFVDEWHPARAIITLWDRPTTPLLTHYDNIGRFTGVFPYLQALTLPFTASPLFGLRFIAALTGALTIPAVYGLARALWGGQMGLPLLAALLLATFPPHLHFSRIGLNNIADPLVACLGFAALLNGLRGGSRADFVLAGAMLGATQYFYEGGRLLYPALYGVFIGALLLTEPLRRRLNQPPLIRRDHLGSLLLVGLVGLIVAAPVLLAWWAHGLSFTPRLEITRSPAREFQWLPPILHLFAIPDGSPFYGGSTPLLLVYTALPAAWGLLTLLRRPFAPPPLLLLPWIAGTIIGNALLESPDESARFVVLFPVLMLLAAHGLAGLGQLVPTGRGIETGRGIPQGGFAQPRPYGVALVVGLLIAGGQVVYYYGQHIPQYNDQVRHFDNDPGMKDHQDVFFRALSLPPGTPVLVITDGVALVSDYNTLNRLYNARVQAEVVAPPDLAAHLANLPTDRAYAIFAETDADWWNDAQLTLLEHFELSEVEYSPFNVPAVRQYGLLLATPRGEAAR